MNKKEKRIAVFMGTRPEAIKMAPVISQLNAHEQLRATVINAGQHREMIQQVIDLFGLTVDHELQVMQKSQTLSGLTSRLMQKMGVLLDEMRPDFALVQGDTTSAMCAALASFYQKIPVGHVEAGLRTGNIHAPFPEEANRRLVTSLASLHFAPTETARQALLGEGISDDTVYVTGNTVIDALFMELERQEQPGVQSRLQDKLIKVIGADWLERPSILVTGHRRENLGDGFDQICAALEDISRRFHETLIVYPVHLNPNVQQIVYQRLGDVENIRLIEPQSYAEFVALAKNCRLILTDSGGVQEEAPSLGKPVLVMRETTERAEGVSAGTVKLVGAQAKTIVKEATRLLTDETAYQSMANTANPYGDGFAAQRILKRLSSCLT